MEQSKLADIFKALSNKQRLKIFLSIHKECCPAVESMEKAFTKSCNCMKLSRSTISHHFKKLHKAGLICCEKKGRVVCCSVNKGTVKAVRSVLK